MLRVGIIGWRGMVGSVLVQRMREEKDFDHVEPVFFSTSQAGGKGPDIGIGLNLGFVILEGAAPSSRASPMPSCCWWPWARSRGRLRIVWEVRPLSTA